jgi:hypothetical protein
MNGLLVRVLSVVDGTVYSSDEEGMEYAHGVSAFVRLHDLTSAPEWYAKENGNG